MIEIQYSTDKPRYSDNTVDMIYFPCTKPFPIYLFLMVATGQGILQFVREILNFVERQGNSRKVREIFKKLQFITNSGDQ